MSKFNLDELCRLRSDLKTGDVVGSTLRHQDQIDRYLKALDDVIGADLSPKGDLISREALKNNEPHYDEEGYRVFYESEIDNAQAVEITEEQAIDKLHESGWLPNHDKEMTARPKGEWIPKRLWDNTHIWVCSECGNQNKHGITVEKACWKCGAEMKGGATNE